MGGVVTGPIYDRGYIRELLFAGTFLTVFGVMMLSLCSEFYQIMLAQGFCVGIGSAILYTPSIALVASLFEKHRALAICFATCGTAVGGILYPIVLEQLLPRVGFAWATRVLGFITLAELIVALGIILPYARNPQEPGETRSLFDWKALKEPAFGVFCLALFFMWIAYWVPFFLIPTFAEYKLGTSRSTAFYILVITNAATLPGRFLGVYACKTIGVSQGLLIFSLLSAVLLFAWSAVFTVASFYAWCVLLGLIMAPLAVFVPAMIPFVCPDKGTVGARMGMAWAAASLGIILGAPLSTALSNLDEGSFWRMQVLVGCCMLAGTGCQLFVHLHVTERIGQPAREQDGQEDLLE